MTSEAQIAANRRNAQKSTGPKTDAGKAKSAQNALRHGLTAAAVVIHDEREEDFAAFHAEMRETLAPQDPIAEHLAERVIVCAWRLRRVTRAEAQVMNEHATPRVSYGMNSITIDGSIINGPQIMSLSRYETALERAFHRDLEMLERWRARRPRPAEKYETKPNLLSAPSGDRHEPAPEAWAGEVSGRGADAATETPAPDRNLSAPAGEESVVGDKNDETNPIRRETLLSARSGARKGPAPQAREGEVSSRDAEATTESPPPEGKEESGIEPAEIAMSSR